MALAALTLDAATQDDTKSWTEVPFGDAGFDSSSRTLPWDPTVPIRIPATEVQIKGVIDRLDLRSGRAAVRVSDYKTGERPRQVDSLVIDGGKELQRTLYGLACQQLIPNCERIIARLVYLRDVPHASALGNLTEAVEQITGFVRCACATLTKGVALPGQDAETEAADLRIAWPASPAYWRRKGSAFSQASDDLSHYWGAK
jgi:hypothetical protein